MYALHTFPGCCWETMDADGNMVLIKAPAYYLPTVKMRLLSPQDYTRYHEINMPNAYPGNADFMQLQIATPHHQPGKHSCTITVHTNICMGSCLPFLSGSPHIPKSSKGCQPCKTSKQSQHALMPIKSSSSSSACISQNIYDECNKNLTELQCHLKLDHDCLGHIGFQRLHHLYTHEHQLPEFDGVHSSTKPCLVAKDPKQVTCQLPVCTTCNAVWRHKWRHGAKHSQPDAKLENIFHSCNRLMRFSEYLQ